MKKGKHVDGSVALSVARPTKSNIVIESFELTRSTRSVIEQNPIVIVCSCVLVRFHIVLPMLSPLVSSWGSSWWPSWGSSWDSSWWSSWGSSVLLVALLGILLGVLLVVLLGILLWIDKCCNELSSVDASVIYVKSSC